MAHEDYNNSIFPYRRPTARIKWKELEKIRSEINTNYEKYRGKRLAIHASYGLNGEAYLYYFENYGFDQINIYKRVRNRS
ncbi:MAG: hypothetical protein IJT16_04575 [Lachnospiraceae bacterium]|nr:hypothetical protein [Lachnospiraceae bacterium]